MSFSDWFYECQAMIKIQRLFLNIDDDDKLILFSRPRVSYEVDKYLWSFIEENVLRYRNLMKSTKHDYIICICLKKFDPHKHRYLIASTYNGALKYELNDDSCQRYPLSDFTQAKERTTWFEPSKIWTNCGDKVLDVDVMSTLVDEYITPRQYADLVYDGMGAALVFNYKRLTKEIFDEQKLNLDWDFIDSFHFPAPFEEQQYLGDNDIIYRYSWDGKVKKDIIGPYVVKDIYLKHFGL